jgi:gas vesicle protein
MAQEEMSTGSWRTRVLLIGALAGAAVGLGTAYLLARTAEEESNGPPQISTTDALKASVSVIGVVRGIASLAKSKK